jgi:hypothetical protein
MINRDLGTVVISSKAGRLGNRLFLSAYFMANAISKGYRLLNPALAEYAHLFEGSLKDPFCAFPSSAVEMDPDIADQSRYVLLDIARALGGIMPRSGILRCLDIRKSHDARDDVFDLNTPDFEDHLRQRGFLFIKGWKFRDHCNLVKYHAEIRKYFTPVAAVRQPAEEIVLSARARGERVVGVHVRQGDYRGWKGGVHYFETEQYAHLMSEVARIFGGRVTFLVCSSDPIDQNLFSGLEFIMGPGSVEADLHALSLCDLIMGPPSTFSTWASYSGRVPLCMLQHHRQEVRERDFVFHDRV